jgi:transposase-like protein
MKNPDKKQQAQFLYMAQGKTQKEISETVDVSARTVYAWIHQYAVTTPIATAFIRRKITRQHSIYHPFITPANGPKELSPQAQSRKQPEAFPQSSTGKSASGIITRAGSNRK